MHELVAYTGTVVMGFFAIMNPFANAPVFLELTADDDGMLWFVTESSHPAYQKSIPFTDKGDIAIKPVAQVVASMQLE